MKRFTSKLLVCVMVLTLAFNARPAMAQGSFSDVPTSHWAYECITDLFEKNVINGMGDGNYAPNSPTTKSQYIKLLTVALEMESGATEVYATDVPENHWSHPYLAEGVAMGIVQESDYADGKFHPNANIDRQTVALWMMRGLGVVTEGITHSFSDITTEDFQTLTAIATAQSEGLMIGSDGKFRPNDSLSRAEVATVISRVMQYDTDGNIADDSPETTTDDDFTNENVQAFATPTGLSITGPVGDSYTCSWTGESDAVYEVVSNGKTYKNISGSSQVVPAPGLTGNVSFKVRRVATDDTQQYVDSPWSETVTTSVVPPEHATPEHATPELPNEQESPEPQRDIFLVRLPTPIIIRVTGTVIDWKKVANATAYEIFCDGKLLKTIENTETLSYKHGMDSGEFTVVAKGDGVEFTDSRTSNEAVLVLQQGLTLDAPTNVSMKNYRLSWASVANAEEYNIHLDGNEVRTVRAPSVSSSYLYNDYKKVDGGTYTVVASAYGYKDSSPSAGVLLREPKPPTDITCEIKDNNLIIYFKSSTVSNYVRVIDSVYSRTVLRGIKQVRIPLSDLQGKDKITIHIASKGNGTETTDSKVAIKVYCVKCLKYTCAHT